MSYTLIFYLDKWNFWYNLGLGVVDFSLPSGMWWYRQGSLLPCATHLRAHEADSLLFLPWLLPHLGGSVITCMQLGPTVIPSEALTGDRVVWPQDEKSTQEGSLLLQMSSRLCEQETLGAHVEVGTGWLWAWPPGGLWAWPPCSVAEDEMIVDGRVRAGPLQHGV